jgi:hypothetical protein
LVQTGARLAGTLALETSDSAPAPIRDGAVQADGVRVPHGEWRGFRFTGRPIRTGGLVTSGSRRWSWSAKPLAEGAEFGAALPRFRASQLLIGRNAAEYRCRGLGAGGGRDVTGLRRGRRRPRRAAGLTPMPAESIGTAGLLPLLGLYRRAELAEAAIRGLEAVRAGLPSGGLQAEFDLLFRSARALARGPPRCGAGAGPPQVEESRVGGCAPGAAGAPGHGLTGVPASESLRYALYRLATLRQRTAPPSPPWERLSGSGPAAFHAAAALLDGYEGGGGVARAGLDFLLTRPWVKDPAGGLDQPADRAHGPTQTGNPGSDLVFRPPRRCAQGGSAGGPGGAARGGRKLDRGAVDEPARTRGRARGAPHPRFRPRPLRHPRDPGRPGAAHVGGAGGPHRGDRLPGTGRRNPDRPGLRAAARARHRGARMAAPADGTCAVRVPGGRPDPADGERRPRAPAAGPSG